MTAYPRLLSAIVSGQLTTENLKSAHWDELIPLAIRHGLAPMLLWRLRQAGRFRQADPIWEPLVKAARGSALHYALLEKTRRAVTAALARSNIPAVWLKGIALAHTIYPQPRLRPMADLDVLVPVEHRFAAREIAQDLGFQPPGGDFLAVVAAPETVRYHDAFLGGPGNKVLLEIHFRLLGLETERLLPQAQLAWFWEQTWAPAGLDFVVLKPEAHLLYLCAHALLQHGEAYLDLLQLLDMHLLITQYQLNWATLVERAHALSWAYALERSLQLTVERFGTQVPGEALSYLRSHRPGDQSLPAARRRRKKVTRWEEWKSIFRRQSPLQRLHLIWTTLFPPANFLRDLYHLTPHQSALPYYLYRWWDGGREILRSLNPRWSKDPSKSSH